MAHQYIYTMQNLRRVHPPNKEALKGIYLSFYPGAKIGVLGSNGSGKSTLLRIMAGVDKAFFEDDKPADGIRIGSMTQEQQRVALCRVLLERPDMLVLDEPTNHLDAESVAWLEHHLHEFPGTIVAVTHDRYFLDNVAGWILELDRGAGIPWEGNYSSWLEQKRQRLQQEEKAESARQRTLARELEWVRMAPRARQAKSKARLQAYETMLAEESERRSDSVEIYIPAGPRLGNVVIESEQVRKAFGDRLLIDDLSFNLPRGGIVGVIGANGA